MADAWDREKARDPKEIKWGSMVVLSVVFHLAVFGSFLFVPESLPTIRPSAGIVYEVDLVELPSKGSAPAAATGKRSGASKPAKVIKKEQKAKRIPAVTKKEEPKPAVIAKRTLDKPTAPPKKSEVSPSDLIDRAISKVERKVKKEEHVEDAISKLEDQFGGSGAILNTRFAKQSSNAIFDQSVQRAIERSDPLPPFPDAYMKDQDEIEIRFNLRDLEEA